MFAIPTPDNDYASKLIILYHRRNEHVKETSLLKLLRAVNFYTKVV